MSNSSRRESISEAPKLATTFPILSITILRYGSLSSLRSSTVLPTMSAIHTILSHPSNPKVAEEFRKYFCSDVICFHALCTDTLLKNFQTNLFHFFIRGLKLTNQDNHHFLCLITSIHSIHKRYNKSNSLQKRCKNYTPM